MSRGLGKIQRAVLEYLQSQKDTPSPRNYKLHGPGWRFASDAIWHAYKIEDGDTLSPAQYNAGFRAIDKLVRMGLVEKIYSTGWYYGKRRGRLKRFEFSYNDREDGGGFCEMLYVRVISVV